MILLVVLAGLVVLSWFLLSSLRESFVNTKEKIASKSAGSYLSIEVPGTSIAASRDYNREAYFKIKLLSYDNRPAKTTYDLYIEVTSGSSGEWAVESADLGGENLLIPAGGSEVKFFYRDTLAGRHVISAEASEVKPTSSSVTIRPAESSQIQFVSPPDRIYPDVPVSLTVRVSDVFDNPFSGADIQLKLTNLSTGEIINKSLKSDNTGKAYYVIETTSGEGENQRIEATAQAGGASTQKPLQISLCKSYNC